MKFRKEYLKKITILSLLVGIVLLTSVLCVSASEMTDYPTGHISDGYEALLPQGSDNNVYEASYDSRQSGFVTPVKDQQDRNCCWAFASIANFEHLSYAQTGRLQTFSEEAMRAVTCVSATNIYGSEYGYYNRVFSGGGTESTATQYLTNSNSDFMCEGNVNWVAPNYDSDVPYNNDRWLPNGYDWYRDKLSSSISNCKLTDAFYISKDEFKKYIKEYGQIIISFNSEPLPENPEEYDESKVYINEDTGAMYIDDDDIGGGHEALCVGWDDNYSRNNFAVAHRPSSDGAWLVKNSWGTDVGEDGYCWLSYEDVTISPQGMVYSKISKNSPNERALSYDFALLSQKIGKTLDIQDNTFAMANIYDLSECDDNYDYVKDVMFYNGNIGASYDIYVVPLDETSSIPTNPSSWGDSLATGTIEHEGYITANLVHNVDVDNVDRIAIIVNFSKDVERPGNEYLFLNKETDVYVYLKQPQVYKLYSKSEANRGESLYLKGGQWKDVVDKIVSDGCSTEGNFCIRPTLVKRGINVQNSSLSTYTKDYIGTNVRTDINLNGNALYRITDDNGNVLHQNVDYSLTNITDDGSVVRFSAKNSYFSDLEETEKRRIIFEFTNGESQTLLVTYRVNIPAVYVSGISALGQTVSVCLGDNYQAIEDLNYQWQKSSDGVEWTNIEGANSSEYIIRLSDVNNYLRCFVSAKSDGIYFYGQSRYSSATDLVTIIYGDVNLDGVVSSSDATMIEKYMNNIVELNTYQLILADVNGDGYVNQLDKDLIVQYVSHLIESFPVES